MNKKKYRKQNAAKRKRIAAGMSVQCRVCQTKTQVKVSDYYANRARCPACGGLVDRVHPPRKGEPTGLDSRRVVPRKLGCRPAGGPS